MALLGRFEKILLDTSGNVQSGVSVSIRKRGATCNGAQSSVTTVVVYNPGALAGGDVVQVNGTGTSYTISSVTATTVVLGASVTVASGDRLVPTIASAPSTYVDSSSTTSKTNPLTTDSNGMAFAYMRAGYYDVMAGSTLLTDVFVWGDSLRGDDLTSPVFIVDTARTVASTDKILSVRNATTEKFYIRGDGHLSGFTAEGAVTIASGGLAVTAGGVTITAGGLTVVASGADITGDITAHNNILIGPAGNVDCNLYRDSANVLKTDDSLTVAATLYSAGYTRVLSPPEITVSSATITLPVAGTAFILNASSPQTVTAISGAVAGQLLIFSAKTGTSTITFSGANFFFPGAQAALDDSSTASTPGMIFIYDGSVFRLVASPRN